MNGLKTMREKREELLQKQRNLIATAEREGRTLTKGEVQDFDNMHSETQTITRQIRMKEATVNRLAEEIDKPKQSTLLADVAIALATGKRDLVQDLQRRDIDTSSGSATIQDPIVTDEIIGTLLDQNRLAELGARIMDVTNYTQWPVVTAPPTVSWYNEGDSITPDSALTISSKKVDLKTCVCLVKLSKLLLHDSPDLARQLVQSEIIGALNNEMIRVVLSGASGNHEPVGLDNVSGVQTVAGGSAVLTDYSKHIEAVGKLLAVNVPLEKIGYVQGITSWGQEAAFDDTTGQPLQQSPRIAGIPNFATSAVLENYGGGTDETRIYVGDWSQMVIGLGGTFRLELVERYADSMETAFLVYMRMDSTVLRPNNFVRIDAIATS